MTQTSPKPSDRNITNGHNETNGDSGFFKSAVPLTTEITTPTASATPLDNATPRQMPQAMNKLSRWQRTSLRTKVTLGAIALGVLPVALLGTIAYNIADIEIVKQLNSTKESQAIDLANQTELILKERFADILAISDLRILVNPQARKASYKEKQEQLDSIAKDSGFYDNIAVADLKGNIILQTSGEAIPNISDRDYFQEVIKTKKSVLIDPRKSADTGKLSLFFAAPVFDSVSGEFIAVVRTRTPSEKVTELLENFATNDNEYYILGREGEVVLANKSDRLGRNAKADFPNLAKFQAAKKTGTALGEV